MITARSAFQIFRSQTGNGSETVLTFNSLPPEKLLPYNIESAEEALLQSLEYVDSHPQDKEKYSVCLLHFATVYLTALISYLPLQARDASLASFAVNFDALLQCLSLYGEAGSEEADSICEAAKNPKDVNLIAVLSDVEAFFKNLEKEYRQRFKEAGEKVEMLKKTAPPPQKRSASPSVNNTAVEGADVEGPKKRSRSRKSVSKKEADASGTEVKKVKRERKMSTKKSSISALFAGRLRALSNAEKKVVSGLENLIQLLALVYANRYNELASIFDELTKRIAGLQEVIDKERQLFEEKEDKSPPEPFHEVSLLPIATAIAKADQTFRNDEECRINFDEDLLHPIAHACLSVINKIEGYETEPFHEPTPEEVEKKNAERAAAKAKREEAQRKILEKVQLKEQIARAVEEEQQRLQQIIYETNDVVPIEDDNVKDPKELGFVQYDETCPLGSPQLFEQALHVWSMLTSVPHAFKLSPMPFATFLKGILLEDETKNGLMEEITSCLLEVTVDHVRISSPNTPKINLRGRTWFESLKEFVATASGNKKKRTVQRKVKETSSEEYSSSSSSSTSSDDSSEEEEEEEEEKQENEKKVEEEDATQKKEEKQEQEEEKPTEGEAEESKPRGFEDELKETMGRVEELRNLASWGNLNVEDRLNLLTYCIQEALASDVVHEEADRILKSRDEKAALLDKKIASIREEAGKELKAFFKLNSKGITEEDADAIAERDAIIAKVEKDVKEAFIEYHKSSDEGDGTIIQPLGSDRYRRLYWRFPLERNIHVQTTDATQPFPLPPMPDVLKKESYPVSILLDDAEGETEEKDKTEEGNGQKSWGEIPQEYLSQFLETMEPRGEREAALLKSLKSVVWYLETLEEPQETRTTRARAYTFGYVNLLKTFF